METPPQRFGVSNQENEKYYPDFSFDQVLTDLGQRNALLWTDLPRGLPRLRGHCRVYIQVAAGKIVKELVERQGKPVDVYLDLNSLRTVKSWTARIEPEERKVSQPDDQKVSSSPAFSTSHGSYAPEVRQQVQLSPRSLDECIPRKREQFQLDEERIHHWPARDRMCLRMVLLMVDGKRSVRTIKEQVHLPSEIIERYLTVLSLMHVIEL